MRPACTKLTLAKKDQYGEGHMDPMRCVDDEDDDDHGVTCR